MSTFTLVCLTIAVVFNLLTVYLMWQNSKSLKRLERLRKDFNASMNNRTVYYIGDLDPGESKDVEIRFSADGKPEVVKPL